MQYYIVRRLSWPLCLLECMSMIRFTQPALTLRPVCKGRPIKPTYIQKNTPVRYIIDYAGRLMSKSKIMLSGAWNTDIGLAGIFPSALIIYSLGQNYSSARLYELHIAVQLGKMHRSRPEVKDPTDALARFHQSVVVLYSLPGVVNWTAWWVRILIRFYSFLSDCQM